MSLEPLFKEWSSFALKRSLISRDIDISSTIKWSRMKIVDLTGVRRSGKSNILMLVAQELNGRGDKVAYVNMEDQRIRFEEGAWD